MSENRLEGKNTIGTGDQKRTKSYKKIECMLTVYSVLIKLRKKHPALFKPKL